MHKKLLILLSIPLSAIADNQFFPANPFSEIKEERFDCEDAPKNITARFMRVPQLFFTRDHGTFARMFDGKGNTVDAFRDKFEFSNHTFEDFKAVICSDETSKFDKFLHLMDAVSNWNNRLSELQIIELICTAVRDAGIDPDTQVYYYEYNNNKLSFTKANLLIAAANSSFVSQFLIETCGANSDCTFYPDWYLKLNAYKLFATHLS